MIEDLIKQNKILVFFGVLIFIRKLIDSKLFIGILVGFFFCYGLNNTSQLSSIFNMRNVQRQEERPDNTFNNMKHINNDIKLKRAFLDMKQIRTNNFLAINNALKHMERFLKIKNNFRELEDTTQFYKLAKIERKKTLDSLHSIFLNIHPRDKIKAVQIIKYIAKVSKRYLMDIAQLNNDLWNQEHINQTISPIYIEELDEYNS